jgi:hypothetical protein
MSWRQRLPRIVEESPGHAIGELMDDGPGLPMRMPGPGDLA